MTIPSLLLTLVGIFNFCSLFLVNPGMRFGAFPCSFMVFLLNWQPSMLSGPDILQSSAF